MTMKKVKPAQPGHIVRDPDTKRPLPPEGAEVDIDTPHWRRRLDRGDLVKVGDDEPEALPPPPRPELDPLTPIATRGEGGDR